MALSTNLKVATLSNMSKVFIYGVPGTGKTYFSKKLGKKLGYPIIEGDQIKARERKGKTKEESPFLFLGTCLAYQKFGELNQKNVVKGLLAVRDVLRSAIEREIKLHEDLILECAFLDPNTLIKLGKPMLLVVLNEEKHKKQFLSHREKILDFQNNEFKAARLVQEYLIAEAKELGIEIVVS